MGSKLFSYLMAYGGFYYKKGILSLFNEPMLFIPSMAFFRFQDYLFDSIGVEKTTELMKYIASFGAYNDGILLKKKFGFAIDKIKNINLLMDTINIDGFGTTKILLDSENLNVNEIKKRDELFFKIENPTVALCAKGKKKKDRKYEAYILGEVIAGCRCHANIEDIDGEEVTCISNSDDNSCLLRLYKKKINHNNFLRKFKVNRIKDSLIRKKTKELTIKNKNRFNVRVKKNIKFKDGFLRINNIIGVEVVLYNFVVLDFLLRSFDPEIQRKAYRILCSAIVDEIHNNFKRTITLEDLAWVGNGYFVANVKGNKRMIIKKEQNLFEEYYKYIFGIENDFINHLDIELLRELFRLQNKNPKINQIKAAVRGDLFSIFEVNL
ncbi:MAG TPA: hypothetical protein ENN46_01280 [Candidatus Woesearchaeota archaeon]|nr:hypothetical protein [Candidatus Woesearchaeota archaeon]